MNTLAYHFSKSHALTSITVHTLNYFWQLLFLYHSVKSNYLPQNKLCHITNIELKWQNMALIQIIPMILHSTFLLRLLRQAYTVSCFGSWGRRIANFGPVCDIYKDLVYKQLNKVWMWLNGEVHTEYRAAPHSTPSAWKANSKHKRQLDPNCNQNLDLSCDKSFFLYLTFMFFGFIHISLYVLLIYLWANSISLT